jgi:hypothetical protein
MTTELNTGELGRETGSPLFFSTAESSKFQVPSSGETSNSAAPKLGFEVWNFSGVWNLEFGTFLPPDA